MGRDDLLRAVLGRSSASVFSVDREGRCTSYNRNRRTAFRSGWALPPRESVAGTLKMLQRLIGENVELVWGRQGPLAGADRSGAGRNSPIGCLLSVPD